MITDINQRWRKGRAIYKIPAARINPRHFEVAEIPELTAKAFVVEHHYEHSYPSARRRFGLFERDRLVGVAVFSHPGHENVITNVFNCAKASSGLTLGRFVLLDSVPANGESWFLARCRQQLKNDYVGVVSFSDDVPRTTADDTQIFAGHLGTIYQASNAAYLGRATARIKRLLPDGRILDERAISKIRKGESGEGYASRILFDYGAREMPNDLEERAKWLDYWLARLTRPLRHPGNLRYAWSFSGTVEMRSLPYPKIKFNDM